MKKRTILLCGLSLVLVMGGFFALRPHFIHLSGFSSKQFTEQDKFEDKDHDEDKDRPTDEDEGGDDSLKHKKRDYDFRAYPATTIPAGSKAKAWEQFQKLYPKNKTAIMKQVTPSGRTNGR